MVTVISEAVLCEGLWLLTQARPPKIRPLSEFAQAEIVLPTGPHAGRRFQLSVQPFLALLWAEMDSGRWACFAVFGCVQSGKTFGATSVPAMAHLFEVGEPIIFAAPTKDMCHDKWRQDLLPTIRASRFGEFLPEHGAGSRGGAFDEIRFGNHSSMKFMTGRGRDEERSGYTARVVICTEVDKYDTAAASSREADPISQLKARTVAYDISERRFYMECTVSTTKGRIYQEYLKGSQSRIACECPHCHAWVTPEREHFVGWQDAESTLQARRLGHFVCPACAEMISDADRREMNLHAKLLHRGQTINAAGETEGELPPTDTLGFRWSAFNNLFWSPAAIAAMEWDGAHAEDQENAERYLDQFVWARPHDPGISEETPLSKSTVSRRIGPWARGVVPPDVVFLTAGVDLGKYSGHYVVTAWRANRSGHVVDYGIFDIPSSSLGVEAAMLIGLKTLADKLAPGYLFPDSKARLIDKILVDARYQGDRVYEFIAGASDAWMPSLGHGASQSRPDWYDLPKQVSRAIKAIGEQYHLARLPRRHLAVCEVNADYWKSWLHERFSLEPPAPASLTIFKALEREHATFAAHITNERLEYVPVTGRGVVARWTNAARRPNHYLDATYLACVAAHLAGFRLGEAGKKQENRGVGEQASKRDDSAARRPVPESAGARQQNWFQRG